MVILDDDVRNEKSCVVFSCDEQSQSIEKGEKKLKIFPRINFVFLELTNKVSVEL